VIWWEREEKGEKRESRERKQRVEEREYVRKGGEEKEGKGKQQNPRSIV
jgi:hypothetical protein